MKIFAIVVTYNGRKWYDRCFGSLRDSECKVSTVVVDNASTDDSVAYIKEHFPEVHIIESETNWGFAKANNIAVKYALDNGADFVFLLNQDAWVEKDTLGALLETYTTVENVGIVSPVHLNGIKDKLDWGFASYVPGDFISDLYLQKLRTIYEVNFINAAAWLISMDSIRKVGGFDTSLFVHYGEDNNYCQRVLFHGLKIIINTKVSICHDREFRLGFEREYRQKVFVMDPFFRDKIVFGNINEKVDILKLKKQQFFSVIKSLLKFSIPGAKMHLKNIKVLNQINVSRMKNINGGLVWLTE